MFNNSAISKPYKPLQIGAGTSGTVKIKATANGLVLENKSDDDKQNPISVTSKEDPIDSIALVNSIKLLDTDINGYLDLTVGSIILEFKRLIYRSILSGYRGYNAWDIDSTSVAALNNIHFCVYYIINECKKDENINNILKYSVDAIFDVIKSKGNDINYNSAIKVYEFIDYFIEAFTSQK